VGPRLHDDAGVDSEPHDQLLVLAEQIGNEIDGVEHVLEWGSLLGLLFRREVSDGPVDPVADGRGLVSSPD
jgi:hypothetical protein